MKIVYPSAGAVAATCAAITPPAPGRFSTTTLWPSASPMPLPTWRATISVMPPAPNGTTSRIG